MLESEALTLKAASKKVQEVKFTEKMARFFRGVWSELKKVHWPNKDEVVTYTSVVLAAVALVATLIWVVDSAFSTLLKFIL